MLLCRSISCYQSVSIHVTLNPDYPTVIVSLCFLSIVFVFISIISCKRVIIIKVVVVIKHTVTGISFHSLNHILVLIEVQVPVRVSPDVPPPVGTFTYLVGRDLHLDNPVTTSSFQCSFSTCLDRKTCHHCLQDGKLFMRDFLSQCHHVNTVVHTFPYSSYQL